MSKALQLARQGLYTTHPNPRVGCVVVKDDRIIATGWHQISGQAHAEIYALERAGDQARGADCYVTLEPCVHTGKTPPCTDALIKAGIKRLIVADIDSNPAVSGQGIKILEQAGIKTESGLLQDQAMDLNIGFHKRMREGMPYVRCKIAMSLDGRTAMSDGESKWITSSQARMDVQHWRAQSAAIMTGVNTVILDDPSLTIRGLDTMGRQPIRVVLDRELRLPADAKMLSLPGQTVVFTRCDDQGKINKLVNKGIDVIPVQEQDKDQFTGKVLSILATQYQANEILLEAGPTLSGSMLAANLIDEIIIYMAPKLMGHMARPLFELPGNNDMADNVELKIVDTRIIGKDMRLILQPRDVDINK